MCYVFFLQVPIIICGNKTDLRHDARRKGMPVVSQDQGQRLSNDVGALFIETSAKDGTNIINACLELAKYVLIDEMDLISYLTVDSCKLQSLSTF